MRNNSKKIITRDSWGRPEGDEWFGFDPERKEYTEKHFTYEDKKARYKKKNDEWFVSSENTDGFVPLKDPKGSRARELERNAKEVKRMSSFEASEKESAEEIAKIRDFRNVVEKGSEIFTGFPGKEKNQYEFRNGNWYEPNPEVEKAIKRAEEDYVPISRIGGGTMTSPTGIGEDFSSEAKSKRSLDAIKDIPKTRVIKDDDRVRALNKQFGKNASLDEDYETFSNYDNSREKRDNKYRVKDGSWERLVGGAEEWSPIENEGSIGALNRRYGKNVEVPKKVKIEEARDISPFLKINKNYLSQTEESAIKKLYKDFNNLGFEFEQEGMLTDYIKVIPKNKDVAPMTFSFDDPKGLDAARLRQYLQSNAEYDSNNSLVNEIRSNVRTNAFNKAIGEDAEVIEGSRADKVGVSKFIDHNNEYYESKEYKDIFKKLNFVEQKEEIERRQMENKPLENKDIFGDFAVWVGLVDKYQGTPEDLKKLKESEKKLYNSEEYKVIYANKRDEYIKEKKKNNEKLLDGYEIALDSRDPKKIKEAKEKIEAGTFVATIGNNINYVSKQQQDYSDEIKNLTKSYEKNQDDYRNRKISAEVYQDRYESLESKRDQLKVVAKEIDTDQKRTKRLTGEYITEKAKYGGFWGNLVNEFIVSADKVAELGVKLDPNLAGTERVKTSKESQIITPEEMKYYKSDALRKGGFTEEEIKNIKANQVKLKSIQQNERMLIEAFGSDLTTEESKQNLGFFKQALIGVAGSLPAMLTRAIPVVGQAAAFVSLADLSMSQIEKEMLTDPDFQTTTAFDRAKVSLPYGIVMGALENFGLNRLTKGQSYLLGKGILGNIAKTLPAGATREVLENIANKEVKNLIGKGVLKVVAGTLAEGETGAIQTFAADIGIKKAYNYLRAAYNTEEDLKKLTGGEAFSTPKTFMEGLSAVGEGALAEAIGGFAMSTVIVNSQLLINGNLSLYNKEDLNFLEDFTSDEQFKKIIVADLKNKMIQGTMTKSQAESALNDIDLVAGVFNSIDENLPEIAKMEAFNLINKRNRLEKSIEGKDESLSKSIKEEIKEINDKLTKLPLKVQEFNGKERLNVLEKALKRKRKDKDIIIVEGKKISRTEAETEYKDLDEKLQSIISEFNAPVVETADTKVDIELNQINQKQKDAIQEQTAGQVPVQPTTAVGEEVVQGEPTTKPQVLTEEGKAEEEVTPSETTKQMTSNDYKVISKKVLDDKELNTVRASLRASSPDSFSLEILDAIAKKESIDTGNDELNQQIDDAIENGLSIGTIANLILEDDVITEGKGIDSKRKAIDYALNIGGKGTILKSGQQAITEEGKAEEKVTAYRAEEQAELLKAIPKIESYKVNGKIDKTKMPKTVLAKYNKIYDKYDALISPLLEPVVKVKTPSSKKEGDVQEVPKTEKAAFNEGVKSVQQAAQEYKDKITAEIKEKQKNYQPERGNTAQPKLFERVSKMIADAYKSIKNEPTKQEVKVAYDAFVSETKKQYEFIVAKGLKVIRHQEAGEPYSNSKEMLQDIRENNTLRFLPNEVAFGQGDVDVSDNIGLQPSGVKLEDGYELTNSEMFRVVHDYFGHGILGNQFGAIGEENATLQHLDLYSDVAAPAVIFQTRGQNSWVNFSGVNAEANQLRKEARELKKQGKLEEENILLEKAEKMFKFAEPKIAIFPTKFNFRRYETARRISEQEDINSRPNRGVDDLPGLLERYSKKSSGTRGVNKRSLRGTKRIGVFDVNVVAEYTLDDAINEGIKKSFPVFKGVQKIFEITDGDTYRKMMEESLKDNPFAASVTVHTGEKFNGMRMFVTEDGSTGITLTKEGFLGGAFSNPNANRPQNLAQLMVIGIKEGATTAEAFDTVLPDYYSKFGFKAVSRTAFNEQYKPMIKNGDAVKDWDFKTYKRFNNGRPDVVFFIYDGGNRNTIEERLGLFDLYEYYEKENTESFDKDSYEKAEEVMNQQAVKRLEFELDINESEAPIATNQGISIKNKSAVDNIKTKTTDKERVKVIEAAQRAIKTLQSVLPNFDIVIHENEESYASSMRSMNAPTDSAGNFSYVQMPDGSYVGRIDINLNKADARTVAHEVAHGVMLKAFGDNPALFKRFRDRIASILKESTNKALMDFANQYVDKETGKLLDVTYEEYLAELTAALAAEEGNLSATTLQKIATLINAIVSKITNGMLKPFEDVKDTKQVVDFFKNISESIRKGEAINPSDIAAIQEGLSVPIGSPTNIINKATLANPLIFPKTPLPLSFVTEADKIDINALIKEIVEKKLNVWFWMADQLGRGNYYDAVIGNEHYLDAGPSFALDPENRDKNILWASGLADKTLQSQIDKADYIFFISGSPEKAKLFNRRVLDLIASRVNKTSDFNSFKEAMNNFKTETNELKDIKNALVKINSFEELAKSPKRKSFLIAIDNVGKNKTTPKGSLKELLGSFNVFIDYNELRDGFYRENDFTQNDIMLVGKPTGLGGNAPHSTYETAILGEVVGVPDVKINSWDIMPQALKDKYQSVIGGRETKTKAMQAKVIAAETGVVRGLEAQIKSKSQLASDGKGETEAKKITELNKKRDSAQKNTIGKNPKLGDITSDLGPLLKQVLNINAKLIPEDVFEDYRKVIEMLSGNRRILSPENRAEIEKKLNNIIRSIEFSNNKASDLKGRYDDFKVNNEDLDYSDSIKKMLEDGIISKEEFDFMKKYKSKIIEAEVKQKMTKEEDEDEKEELIAEIKDTTVTTDEFKGDEFRLERDFVNKFIETLKNSDLEGLNNSDLNDLVKIIYNINNGFVNHAASQMLIKLESNIKEATLVEAIPDSYGGVVRRIQQWLRTLDVNIANIKLRIKNDKYGVGSNSLFNIDEMFGDFKTKRIFNSIFNESAKAQQTYQSEIKDVQGRLIEAENAVFNSFKKDGNALIKSQMKSMLYMIQLEYESNEGSKQTRPALAVLDAVIEFAKIKGVTEMSKQDLKVMQDIKKNFVVDGKIDIDKILSSFNKAEISALKVMQSINEEMTKKATFTSYVINGSQLKPLKNYVPQMVAQKTNQETIDEQIDRIKNNINPGTESNNLIERNDFNEKNVSPVILNPYFAINQSSKSLLINYHLADPIRTARMTLKKAELNLKENKKDSEAREMLEVISQSYETALNDLLSQNFGQTNKFIDALAKVGYSSMLASAPRMFSEAISNTFFVMTNNPVDYSVGASMYGKLAFGVDGKKVLTNLNSKVTSRNYSEAGENSAMFDLSALTNRISRKGKMDTIIVNGVVQVYDNFLGRYVNLVSLVANNVVSQPDKVMIKPLWFGSFARRFEKITGETIDFNKIINNDEEYLNKYKDALSKSTDWADSQVVLAGASTNPFMGVLKNVSREDDNLYETAVKNFNRFMNKFMINEYFTIRKGVFAMIGKGDISREDGLLLLAAASQRLFLYGILTRLSSEVLVFVLRGTFNNFADMALGIDDDDEEKEVEKLKLKYDKFDDKKESYNKTLEEMMLRKIINKKEFDLMQNNKDNIQGLGEFLSEKPLTERVMQSVLGSATGMILGRNYGNFTRMWQNYLVEQVNKKYGDDLGIWDGEYDPYKDALAYNPFEGKKIDESTDLLTIISGPYAPHLNFMTTLLKASNKSEPKEERTILTRKKERLRYFIEGSGMLNMLPFYKDFRKSAMDYVYKEVKVEKQQEVNLKEKKIDILKNIEADKNNEYEPEDLKHWIKYVEDPDYKKKYDDKEEKIVDGILKEYGYKTKTEFEYEDIRGYKKEFGNYSDYSKERKGKSKIENELDDRIEAFKYGEEYNKSSRSGRSRSVWGRKKRSKWSK